MHNQISEGALRNMTRRAGNYFGPNFEKIKEEMKAFWDEGRKPEKKDIEMFFDKIDEFAGVPQGQIPYVRGMVNFALAYPERLQKFNRELDELFPPARTFSVKNAIETVKNNTDVTEASLQEALMQIKEIAKNPDRITEDQKVESEQGSLKVIDIDEASRNIPPKSEAPEGPDLDD